MAGESDKSRTTRALLRATAEALDQSPGSGSAEQDEQEQDKAGKCVRCHGKLLDALKTKGAEAPLLTLERRHLRT